MFYKISLAIIRGLLWAACIFIVLGAFVLIVLGIGWGFAYSPWAGLGAVFLVVAAVIAACKYDEIPRGRYRHDRTE